MPTGIPKNGINKGWFRKRHKGYRSWSDKKFSKEHKQKLKKNHKGTSGKHWKWTEKSRMKKRKDKNPMWRGGITSLRKQIFNSIEYKKWRKGIFERDSYTCCECHRIGGKLHPHHIKSQAIILAENKIKTFREALKCKELWNINNGITLCEECHKLTDTFGAKGHLKIINNINGK